MDASLTPETIATICEHMNDDHGDAILHYARAHAGIADAQSATIKSMDAAGMQLEVRTAQGLRIAHVSFDHTLADSDDARQTLIRMAH
jgi:putative heme iron utilization protein